MDYRQIAIKRNEIFEEKLKMKNFGRLKLSGTIYEAFSRYLKDSKSYLQFFCANGYYLKYAEHFGAENIFGIDPSNIAIDISREQFKNSNCKNMFISSGSEILISFDDESIDAIILTDIPKEIIYYDGQYIFDSLYRILKTNGKIFAIKDEANAITLESFIEIKKMKIIYNKKLDEINSKELIIMEK
ncbi:MAG: class I SAM-dependent methyltransferase [Tissierellia bacterium]|nr:class I SAM-dependent methyltransferase [Tissierellia bacterium]